jgi:deoxyribonuclease V
VGDIIWQIPPGSVSTFGDVARALGDVVAARAVAAMVLDELDPDEFPTHRVVRTDATLGVHPLGEGEKARRLAGEGVPVEGERVVDMDGLRHTDLRSDRPLAKLRDVQNALGDRLNLGPMGGRPRDLVGVDVAYSRCGPAHAAAVLVDAGSMEVLDTRTVEVAVDFPYIPTYLAFREMPAVEAAMEGVEMDDALILVDGQGTLHPRGFGIACHLGVALGVPSIGVAKRMLCGTYDRAALHTDGHAEVLRDGEQAGWVISPHGAVKRAVFASPGHMVGLRDTLDIVTRSLGRRQPLPLELAHEAATAARRSGEAHSTTSSRP